MASAIVTAVLLPVAVIGGRGNTTFLRLLFPVALYLGDWTHSEFCCLIVALLQWPIYGTILGWALDKRSMLAWLAVTGVLVIHILLAWSLA